VTLVRVLRTSRLVDQVGANAVQRAGVFYVEGSRCDHVKTLPPVCCRASAVQRELTAHNCEHGCQSTRLRPPAADGTDGCCRDEGEHLVELIGVDSE
jgi:hypothetical protein